MSESIQAVLALLMIVGGIGSALVFTNDRVNWPVFSGFLSLSIGSLGILLWSLFRRDKAPNFLKQIPGGMFERDGFCFKIIVNPVNGRCFLDLHFQSRYDRASKAMVVLQPSKGFFLTRPDLASMTVEIECPGGGYGVTQIPWAVGKPFQGRSQTLDVGADVFYPDGKGTMIRYAGGKQVGSAGFDVSRAILTVAGAMGGMIIYSSKAKAKFRLPTNVDESIPENTAITTKIIWKLGG